MHLKTYSAKVWETNFLLTCLVNYVIVEKRQDTFNTQQNITQQEVQSVVFLKIN